MSLVPFNPFDTNLEELEPSNLNVLRSVAEGWYIEYKSRLVSASSIAKSIAAFANHYGGWLFYGIEDANDGSNTAGSFPGLDQNDVSLIVERIRNAAKDAINPSPYYEYKTLIGPCNEIGLPENRSVVVVLIPSGPNAPYIHSNGRIYRRVADSSDPKPETDRFILDQLWQRGQNSQSRLVSLLQTKPTLSEGEDEVSVMELFLLPDPLGASGQRSKLTFDDFTELMTDSTAPGISILCDNFFAMADGFIGRQIGTNDPFNLVITWKHYRNGFSVVSIPFASTLIDEISIGGWLHGYEHEVTVAQLIQTRKHSGSHLLDLNQLMFAVMAVVDQQKRLMTRGDIKGPLYAKAALHNIWRRIPFLDTETYVRFVSKHGFPVIQFTNEYAPPDTTFESLLLIPESESQDESEHLNNQARSGAVVLAHILNAVGLPIEFIVADENSISAWGDAALRAPNVSKHREEMFRGQAW